MVKFYCVFSIGLLITLSCAKVGLKEKWDLKLNKLESDKLRFDGYYYIGDSVKLYDPFFLFSNGVICREFNQFEAKSYLSSFEYFESLMNNLRFKTNFNGQEENWGIVEIFNSKIIFQYRRYDSNYGTYRHADVMEGEILNDTTFVFKEKYRIKRGRKKDVEKLKYPLVYKFRYFNTKPDSINPFIK